MRGYFANLLSGAAGKGFSIGELSALRRRLAFSIRRFNPQLASFFSDDPYAFYQGLSAETYKEKRKEAGFVRSPDIDAILPFLSTLNSRFDFKSHPVLEGGAGDGRVIDALLNSGFNNEIHGVEFVPQKAERLKKKYANNPQVKIIEGDVRDPSIFENYPPGFFGLMLYLYAFPSDYKLSQHLSLFPPMSVLSSNGVAVYETQKFSKSLRNTSATGVVDGDDEVNTIVDLDNLPKIKGRVPFLLDMQQYAEELRLDVKMLPYETETSRDRQLYFFTHKCKYSEKNDGVSMKLNPDEVSHTRAKCSAA